MSGAASVWSALLGLPPSPVAVALPPPAPPPSAPALPPRVARHVASLRRSLALIPSPPDPRDEGLTEAVGRARAAFKAAQAGMAGSDGGGTHRHQLTLTHGAAEAGGKRGPSLAF